MWAAANELVSTAKALDFYPRSPEYSPNPN